MSYNQTQRNNVSIQEQAPVPEVMANRTHTLEIGVENLRRALATFVATEENTTHTPWNSYRPAAINHTQESWDGSEATPTVAYQEPAPATDDRAAAETAAVYSVYDQMEQQNPLYERTGQ